MQNPILSGVLKSVKCDQMSKVVSPQVVSSQEFDTLSQSKIVIEDGETVKKSIFVVKPVVVQLNPDEEGKK